MGLWMFVDPVGQILKGETFGDLYQDTQSRKTIGAR